MKHLTPKEAWQRIAATSTQQKAKGMPSMPETLIAKDDIYIFGQDDTATITTAYEELPVILGQWEEGEGTMPDALVELIGEYNKQLAWWKTTGSAMPEDRRRAKAKAYAQNDIASRKNVDMLVKTKWSQWAPFNDNVHFDNKPCPSGCMPLAIAQLMYFWKEYKRGCTALPPYKTDTNKYKVEGMKPITLFDYDNLVLNPKSKEEKAAVALMLEYLGKACKSDYTANGTYSNTSRGYYAIKDFVRLAPKPSMMYAQQVGEVTFESRVYKDIAQGMPVILSGSSKSSSHAFLVDGYRNGLYHINWGWGGSYNGWFALSALNPGTKEYNSYKCAILNIKPDYAFGDVNKNGEVTVNDAVAAMEMAKNGEYSKEADVNNDGEVSITDAQIIIKEAMK